jgi:hypothetical protein
MIVSVLRGSQRLSRRHTLGEQRLIRVGNRLLLLNLRSIRSHRRHSRGRGATQARANRAGAGKAGAERHPCGCLVWIENLAAEPFEEARALRRSRSHRLAPPPSVGVAPAAAAILMIGRIERQRRRRS